MSRSRGMAVLMWTSAFLLMVTVFISGCATDEAATRPTFNYQVTSSVTLTEPGELSVDGWSDTDARVASDPIELIRVQLIRLLTINSLMTTHVAVLPR